MIAVAATARHHRAPATLDQQIADYLAGFWPELPPQHIQMNATGPRKYAWVKSDGQFVPLTRADLVAHARGEKAIGAHLHSNGLARNGALDIDDGGLAAIGAALAAAHQLGVAAYGIYMPGAEHDGGDRDADHHVLGQRRLLLALRGDVDGGRRRAAVAGLPGVATSASATRFLRALIGGKTGIAPVLRSQLESAQAVAVRTASLRALQVLGVGDQRALMETALADKDPADLKGHYTRGSEDLGSLRTVLTALRSLA